MMPPASNHGSVLRDPAVLAILTGALLLRLGVAAWPVIAHPDELWQYLEPAYHIVAGRWVETWDFRSGLRSWLLPVVLSGPMALGHAIAPSSWLDLFLARMLCTAIAMLGIWACMVLGRRLSRAHGLIAGIATACWFELVYLGPRTAAEPVATGLALLATSLLATRGSKRLMLAGLLFGLSCAIRIQYAPALAVLALGMTGLDRRRFLFVAAGGLGGLAISGIADLAMGAVPFRWIARSFAINVTQGKAATFGVEPFWWYGHEAWNVCGPGILAIMILALVGSRRYPWLFLSAIANLAIHSVIAHKEYRFIFYTSSIVILLAAIGSVDLWARYVRDRVGIDHRLRSLAVLGSAWIALSALCAGLGTATATWGVNGRMIAAWKIAGAVPHVCGMAIYRLVDVAVASYALFGRDVPIYQYDAAHGLAGTRSSAFNVALAERRFGADLKGFHRISCDRLDYFCVFARPGPCVATPADHYFDENRFLKREGS